MPSLTLSALSIPSINLSHSSSSCSSRSNSLSGSHLWTSNSSDTQTDITPPGSPCKETSDTTLDPLSHPIPNAAHDESSTSRFIHNSPCPYHGLDNQDDAGYEAETEGEKKSLKARTKSGRSRSLSRVRGKRTERHHPVAAPAKLPLSAYVETIPLLDLTEVSKLQTQSIPVQPVLSKARKAPIGLGLGMPSTYHSQTCATPMATQSLNLSPLSPEQLPQCLLPTQVFMGLSLSTEEKQKLSVHPTIISDSPSPITSLPSPLLSSDSNSISSRSFAPVTCGQRRPAFRWSQLQKERVPMPGRIGSALSPIMEVDYEE